MLRKFLLITSLTCLFISSYDDQRNPSIGSKKNDTIIVADNMTATQKFVKNELEMVKIDEKVGNILDVDLTFYDLEGNPVLFKDFLGNKPLILSFAYYSCTLICQFVLQGQVDVFNRLEMILGKDYNAVTISFDSKDDAELTTEMTKIYAKKTVREGNQAEWTFLYGKDEEIRSITDQLGFYFDFIEASGEFAHSAAFYVITPRGKISRYFYGIQFNPFDLQLAIIEAKDEKTRSTIENFLMYCYQYDAESRGYALVARRVMQAGGVITVAIIGIFIAFANRKKIMKS